MYLCFILRPIAVPFDKRSTPKYHTKKWLTKCVYLVIFTIKYQDLSIDIDYLFFLEKRLFEFQRGFFCEFPRLFALYAIPLNDFTPCRIHVGTSSKRFTLEVLNPRSFPDNLYTVKLLAKLTNQKHWCSLPSLVLLMVKNSNRALCITARKVSSMFKMTIICNFLPLYN